MMSRTPIQIFIIIMRYKILYIFEIKLFDTEGLDRKRAADGKKQTRFDFNSEGRS